MQYLLLLGLLVAFFVLFVAIMALLNGYFSRMNDRLEREQKQYQRWLKEQEWEEENMGI